MNNPSSEAGEPLGDLRYSGHTMAAVRVLLGLLWLQNVGWKVPPNFAPVERFVQRGIDTPVFPPYSALLESLVAPNLKLFGWLTLLTELALAVFLLSGLATRLWAAVGAVQCLAIGLTVANAEHEWGWAYWLMIAAHVAVFATASGRVAGLDSFLRPALRQRRDAVSKTYLRWAS